MKKFLVAYRMINILSLDVAAGAMICSSFFARLLDVVILPQGLISLGMTVWIIYTSDHLLDAKKLKQDASTERHRFHQRHFKILLILMLMAAFVDLVQIYFIRDVVFVAGLWLSSAVAFYFLVQQRLGFLKELLGALLYTGGVLLIPISDSRTPASASILLMLHFGLTTWINLLLFSWIDRQRDEADNHRSFATACGEEKTKQILDALFVVSMLLAIVQFIFSTNVFSTIIVALMNVGLLLIFLRRKYFEREARYRLLGDAVFLIPIIYLLF